jgi:putative phage-type endonuclease
MWIDIEQNSDEWFDLRQGKITASHFATIMAHYPNGLGDLAKRYAERVALEIVTGERNDEDDFKSVWMERGNEYEPIAKQLYEMETFRKVTNGGFFVLNDLGDSPDGIIGEHGRIEIKCVKASTQWKRLKKGGYDLSYKWQIQGHLWIGNAGWCDFVQYSPKMPENKQLYIYTVKRDEVMISQLRERMELFRAEVKMNVKILE